jgi:hypothetical protein
MIPGSIGNEAARRCGHLCSEPGAHAELSACIACRHEIARARQRPHTHHRIRHSLAHRFDGGQRRRRAQCDFQNTQAASAQRASERHGVIDVLDGEHRDDRSECENRSDVHEK